jgi:AcrR family transcriptional regulator
MPQDRLSRVERKQRTREAFLEATLRLASERGSFSTLSLREVAREVGVVPTAFYRHFRDLDEIGLELVAEGGASLRRLLREVRAAGVPDVDMVRRSVLAYLTYAEQHREHVLLIASERVGGSPVLRRAVRAELDQLAREMAQDLRGLDFLTHLSVPTLERVCGLVVDTMIAAAAEILDTLTVDAASRERRIEEFVFQLRLIFSGAAHWIER